MAGSHCAGTPPLPHTFNEWASEPTSCMARRDGVEEEEKREEQKAWDWDFGGQGMQATPPGSPVTANDAELEKVGALNGVKEELTDGYV